jgi:hypothetical protein
MNRRIYISEALKYLNYKDNRSFIIWCNNNGVAIRKDYGTKWNYVLENEFEEVFEKQNNVIVNHSYDKTMVCSEFLKKLPYHENYYMTRLLNKFNQL